MRQIVALCLLLIIVGTPLALVLDGHEAVAEMEALAGAIAGRNSFSAVWAMPPSLAVAAETQTSAPPEQRKPSPAPATSQSSGDFAALARTASSLFHSDGQSFGEYNALANLDWSATSAIVGDNNGVVRVAVSYDRSPVVLLLACTTRAPTSWLPQPPEPVRHERFAWTQSRHPGQVDFSYQPIPVQPLPAGSQDLARTFLSSGSGVAPLILKRHS